MTTANEILTKSLDSLAVKLAELAREHSSELQPIREAVAAIYTRGLETGAFRRNLMQLAEAVIRIRMDAGRSSSPLMDLPVPPYDLWLPFMAQSSAHAGNEELAASSQIFTDKILNLAVRFRPNIPSEKDVQSSDHGDSRNQIFVSYCQADSKWLEDLTAHLVPFLKKRNVNLEETIWRDGKIQAGDEWRESIETALRKAKAAILLVTPDFLASDFIRNYELPKLLARAKAKQLRLFWVSVRPSLFDQAGIDNYQCLNDPMHPLVELQGVQRDKELVQICRKIYEAISLSVGEVIA